MDERCKKLLRKYLDRSERLAKYNQLLRIEEELGTNAKFAGANFRKVGHFEPPSPHFKCVETLA